MDLNAPSSAAVYNQPAESKVHVCINTSTSLVLVSRYGVVGVVRALSVNPTVEDATVIRADVREPSVEGHVCPKDTSRYQTHTLCA